MPLSMRLKGRFTEGVRALEAHPRARGSHVVRAASSLRDCAPCGYEPLDVSTQNHNKHTTNNWVVLTRKSKLRHAS